MELGRQRRGDRAERPLREVDDPVGPVHEDQTDPEQCAEHADDQSLQVHPARDRLRFGERREDRFPSEDDEHEATDEGGKCYERAAIPHRPPQVPSAVCVPELRWLDILTWPDSAVNLPSV
jgi:hypothetical protein